MCGFFLLPVLVLASNYAAQAQAPTLAPEPATLVGTYRLTYQPDSTNPAKRTDIFYLLLGKTLSKFQSRGEQATDSLVTIDYLRRSTYQSNRRLSNHPTTTGSAPQPLSLFHL